MLKLTKISAMLLAGASAVALASPAAAQVAASPASSDNPASSARDIVITGSRVITNGNNSPTPVTVLPTEQLQASTPTNIPDGLNKLPVFNGSRNQIAIGGANQNNVGNFLNLRGVGIIRTLILFDGHRVPGTAQDGLVDTNTIPQLLLQRVDVVTGGASAVYGSDAVTGVVNFVIDKKFNGIKGIAQAGISRYGDNANQRFGIAGGFGLFGGRGHFEASYEYFNSDGIGLKNDRAIGRLVYSQQGAGTADNPFHLVANTRNAAFSFGGLIKSGPLNGQQFVSNGVLGPFVHGSATGSTGIESGGDGTYAFNSALTSTLRSHQGFGRFDFDVSDSIKFYAQVAATQSDNAADTGPFNYNNVTISSQNAFLPLSVRTQLANAGVASFTFAKALGSKTSNRVDSRTRSLLAYTGLTGDFGSGITWDVSYGRSVSITRVIAVNNVNAGKYAAALDAVRAPNGDIVCNVTLTNPGLYPGCIPLNPFGPTSETDEMISYIRQNSQFKLTNKMDDFAGSITATPFNTWAGPVKVALSADHRRLTLNNFTAAQSTDRLNCTGLRFNCASTTPPFTGILTSNVHASQRVTEGALEADVPLLRDSPLLGSLNVNGAVRYTHYTTSGNATTWKAGIDWHPFDELTLRGTRSRDIRAPTLNDLFAPVSAFNTGFSDIHTKTSGLVPSQSQGNINLVPEVAQTLTIGGVYRPRWFPGFSAAVDYFHIRIDKAITTVGGNNSTTLAQCEASGGTSPLCALYIRPLPFSNTTPANYPTLILTQGLNVANVKLHGIDGEMNYTTPLAGGRLNLRGLISYQPKQVTVQFPGAIPINAAGAAGLPSVKVSAFVHFDKGLFSIDVLERWHNATLQSGNPVLIYSTPKVEAVSFTDLTLAMNASKGKLPLTFFITVQNLFDRDSPVFADAAFASSPAFRYPSGNGDDVIGRNFTVGVRTRF